MSCLEHPEYEGTTEPPKDCTSCTTLLVQMELVRIMDEQMVKMREDLKDSE